MKVAYDLGNGFFKKSNGKKEKSVYCYTKPQIDGSQKGISINKGKKKLYGSSAENSGYDLIPIVGASDSARYQDSNFYDMIVASLEKSVETLIIGLPNNHFKTERKVIIDNLENKNFDKDGKKITIGKVIVVPQPFGTYIQENEKGKVLIIDIGHGTIDYSVFNNSELINDFSTNQGMKRAYESVLGYIKIKYPNFETNLISVADCLIHGVSVAGEKKRILDDSFIQEILKEHFVKVVREAIDYFGSFDNFDKIIFTGGGALMHKPRIEKISKIQKNIKIAKDPQMANVNGFAKIGE